MQNLHRRASGIYVVRLVVPKRLRPVVKLREMIASTRTRELVIAKIIALDHLARWRRQFFDLDRLALTHMPNSEHSLIKVLDGHPALSLPGHLTLEAAAAASGVSEDVLLRQAAEGSLRLFWRLTNTHGYLASDRSLRSRLVRAGDKEILEYEGGDEVVIPSSPPYDAQFLRASGAYALTPDASPLVASILLAGVSTPTVVTFASDRDGCLFVPDEVVCIERAGLEVLALQVDAIRRRMAAVVPAEQQEAVRNARATAWTHADTSTSHQGEKLLSEALAAYAAVELPRTIHKPKEIERVRSGIALLIEFEGDLKLKQVNVEVLRRFKQGPLQTLLARENHVRTKYGTTSMKASIEAVAGLSWPIMSSAERELRLTWIRRMFDWLTDHKWITDNPATAYKAASVLTKAQRKVEEKGKDKRLAFTSDELTNIFSSPWYRSGRGVLASDGKVDRGFQPFQYWLPLLGLLCGCRIGEASQLWLEDIKCTQGGTWYLHIHEETADKDLKNEWSARKVPLHPLIMKAGFTDWCDRLRAAGFKRVFPELSWNETNQYAKEPIRAHSSLFMSLGMPRNNTKVFHSFRRNLNTALEKVPGATDVARKRIMGHLPGEGVNERHYLEDRSPDETIEFMKTLDFGLPELAKFDLDFGLNAVHAALARKLGRRKGREDMGEAAT